MSENKSYSSEEYFEFISSEKKNKTKGDLFEIYCKAYLEYYYPDNPVFLYSEAPKKILNELNLPKTDKGIDIIMFDSVEKEYNKLTEKKIKLSTEREDVLVMINEVDGKKKELFMKTYDVVNHNFKEIFNTLSSKGTATMDLEDKNDPFNGGVNIKVKLSGNKYLDIRGLSGGEKTLTALAFIFAVQEHEPAAFYVLDEVDAALDKKNSQRLAKLVHEYSKRAQYIMISHNDNVISEASTLYGVSMNEHGESKITSLKI